MRTSQQVTLMWVTVILAFGTGIATAQDIVVLSNRADLISGGDALVEIKLPASVAKTAAGVSVEIDGRNVTDAFKVRGDGRYYGVVTGLKNGANALTATAAGARSRITITNHPLGGPIF